MYTDFDFDTDADLICTCMMCGTDCPLESISSGCCPDCASLAASVPVRYQDNLSRRSRLICLTRRALLRWELSGQLFIDLETAFCPSAACVEKAYVSVKHFIRRYNALESALADESGLAKWQVFNELKAFPLCSRLLTTNL